MVELNINVSRSGSDEISTHDAISTANERIYAKDVMHLTNEYKRLYGSIPDYDRVMLAIDTLIVYFANTSIAGLLINVNQREYSASPKKKMTKTEIEKELGYPIEIVKGE